MQETEIWVKAKHCRSPRATAEPAGWARPGCHDNSKTAMAPRIAKYFYFFGQIPACGLHRSVSHVEVDIDNVYNACPLITVI